MSLVRKSFLVILCFFGARGVEQAPDFSSGKTEIIKIMSKAQQCVHCASTVNLVKDLEIPKIAEFFGCKTVIGREHLEQALACPLDSRDQKTILVSRQNSTKILVQNPVLKKEIELLLKRAQEEEKVVIELMSQACIGAAVQELEELESLHSINPGLYYVMKTYKRDPIVTSGHFYAPFFLIPFEAYKAFRNGMASPIWTAFWTWQATVGVIGTYLGYKSALALRARLHALNRLIDIAENIEKLCTQSALAQQFKLSNLKNFEGLALVHEIKHARYVPKKLFVFHLPGVIETFYRVCESKQYLAEIFASIAEIDAYNAIANKVIETQNTQNKFCFSASIESNNPVVNTTGFWNVLVPKPVLNNLGESKNIILTGPNAGGKTTTVRALLQNIVMAQSFGVAAASVFEHTFFDVIHSYLHASDNISKGLSLFASEVRRAKEILTTAQFLSSDKKYFFALDELFTGTTFEAGELCAYKFVARIAQFLNVQFVYATHFEKLKELPKVCSRCVNYKVGAPVKNSDGVLVYPFTLSLGANEVNVALDIARAEKLFA